MQLFFKNRILLDGLEFGFEARKIMGVGAAVGAAAGVGKSVSIVCLFVARTAPVASME